MKIANPNEVHTFNNRYNSRFTFTKINPKTILWEGDFQYSRTGFPNCYKEAYDYYLEQEGKNDNILSLEEFKEAVHEWDDEKMKYTPLAQKYQTMVKSRKDIIDMVDTSGGPYLTEGMDMKMFGFGENNIIKEFKSGGDSKTMLIILK